VWDFFFFYNGGETGFEICVFHLMTGDGNVWRKRVGMILGDSLLVSSLIHSRGRPREERTREWIAAELFFVFLLFLYRIFCGVLGLSIDST